MLVRRLGPPALAAALLLMSGCGGAIDVSATDDIDLQQLVTILPTPTGLTFESSAVREADAAAVQAVFAGRGSAESAKVLEGTGFESAAIRTWEGPNGAELVVVASRWPDHQRATNWGGGAAELVLSTPGTKAWTPSDLPGARGARATSGSGVRALSLAVADINVFVRADGPLDDSAAVRTLERALRPIRAAVEGGDGGG